MLVYMLTNLPYINLMLEPLLTDCKYLIKTFLNCIVSHVYRESNRCADSLEKNESFTWYDHGFKNWIGHRIVFFFFLIFDSTLVFDRFSDFWPVFGVLTGRLAPVPGWTGRTGRSGPVFKTVDMISVFCMTCPCGRLVFDKAEFDFW